MDMDHGMENMGMKMNNSGGDMMMMMQMTFYASNKVTLFFDGWKTHNGLEMFGSCMFIIFLGVFYEGFKYFRQYLIKRTKTAGSSNGGYGSIGGEDSQPLVRTKLAQIGRGAHILQSFLHIIQIFFGYLLMLAFMTYNAYICISVLIGAGLGYLLFGSIDAQQQQGIGDHCNM